MSLINCNECGRQVSTQAKNCPNCGAPIVTSIVTSENIKIEHYIEQKPAKPKDNLVWAILSTLCCAPLGVPFGVVAIVHSAKVDSLYHNGNYAEAQKEADIARKWAIRSVIAGIVFWTLHIIFLVVLYMPFLIDLLEDYIF